MDTNSTGSFLAKIQLFDNLEKEEIDALIPEIEKKQFVKDEVIFAENSPRRYLYLVYEGEIELFKKSPLGDERRVAFFRKFDFIGEGALMDDYPHSLSARSTTDSTVFALDRDKFKEMFKHFPEIGYKVLSNAARVMSRRIRQSTGQIMATGAQYASGRTRTEHDLLGDREVPYESYYGIQTLRGLENFNISGVTLAHFPIIIEAYAMVKMAAAKANFDIGLLPEPLADAIVQACSDIINGKLHSHFVIDMIQGGAGTSTNMNTNEVIANLALEILGHEKGEYEYCHPHNHINLSQSTNDSYPTAMKVALIYLNRRLMKTLAELVSAFREKQKEFAHIIKMGRTQLQDAVPMTLGQTFGVFASTLGEEIQRLEANADLSLKVNMGGTAIGTGINADPRYSAKVVKHLCEITGLEIKLAEDLIEETQDTGGFVMYSSAIKRLAIKLSKICNDLRLLASGPRAGFNEINLPKMAPGSSIMPGKVNPIIPEVVNQIAFKVIGNDLTVSLASEAGQLELNVMEPVIIQSMFESVEMLRNGITTLIHRCIKGITANEDVCRAAVENSIGIVTALNPTLGYEVCTELAKEALETGKSLYGLILEKNILSKEKLDRLLVPESMVGST